VRRRRRRRGVCRWERAGRSGILGLGRRNASTRSRAATRRGCMTASWNGRGLKARERRIETRPRSPPATSLRSPILSANTSRHQPPRSWTYLAERRNRLAPRTTVTAAASPTRTRGAVALQRPAPIDAGRVHISQRPLSLALVPLCQRQGRGFGGWGG